MFEKYTNDPTINNSVKSGLYIVDSVCKWVSSFFTKPLYANFYYKSHSAENHEGEIYPGSEASLTLQSQEALEFEDIDAFNKTTNVKPELQKQTSLLDELLAKAAEEDDVDADHVEGMFEYSDDFPERQDSVAEETEKLHNLLSAKFLLVKEEYEAELTILDKELEQQAAEALAASSKHTLQRQDRIIVESDYEDSEESEDEFYMDSFNTIEDPIANGFKYGINPLEHHISECRSGECSHEGVAALVGHHQNLVDAAQ